MTDRIAFLWWENQVQWEDGEKPFTKEWKNNDYRVYAELFEEKDVEFYAAEYRWLEEDTLEKAWSWNGEEWVQEEDITVQTVYDLFRHSEEKMSLKKEMQEHVTLINKPEVADLCQDKLKTYREFSEYVPDTKKANEENIRSMLDEYGEVVMKPQYGSAGKGIERVENIEEVDRHEDMLVQRFVSSPKLPEFDIQNFHDLRILIIEGEVMGGYLRIPQDDEFLSNVAQGASIRYLRKEELPDSVFPVIQEVSDYFQQYSPVIYTVDFIFEQGEPSIMELNSQPGIYYHQEVADKDYEYPWMKKVVDTLEKSF